MERTRILWWSRTRRLMILYLAAGAWFAPAGLIYALLVFSHHESTFAALVLLAATSIPAMLTWNYCERRLFRVTRPSLLTAQSTFSPVRHLGGGFQLAASACYVIVLVSPTATDWRTERANLVEANKSLAQSRWVYVARNQ